MSIHVSREWLHKEYFLAKKWASLMYGSLLMYVATDKGSEYVDASI